MTVTPLDKIISFEPQFKQVIWGGSRISELKGEPSTSSKIGESWEISALEGYESVVADGQHKGQTITRLAADFGEQLLGRKVVRNYGKKFPLLIKLLDAHDILSLQVHPNDRMAGRRHNSRGKSEMWYVIDAKPGAKIFCGHTGQLTPDNLDRHVRANTIMDIVVPYPSRAGQFYFIPAGTLHSIGAGNLIAEVQESSDITYRVYDHNRLGADGRPRELHMDEACEAIDFTYPRVIEPTAKTFDASRHKAVSSEHFAVDYLVAGDGDIKIDLDGESFVAILVTEGAVTIKADDEERVLTAGHTVLIPAAVKNLAVTGSGKALSIYV